MNALLSAWSELCASDVIGAVGHHRTEPGGGATPTAHSSAWVTARGCDVAKLHRAYCIRSVFESRGEDAECYAAPAKVRRMRRVKGNVVAMRKTA